MNTGTQGRARARACANIALAKYWGKSDETLNLPAVPSVSVTLDALVTETVVERDPSLTSDHVTIDDVVREGSEARKVTALLDLLRLRAGVTGYARVVSHNRFPTASGLASSASGFAALTAAAARAYGADLPLEALDELSYRLVVGILRGKEAGRVHVAQQCASCLVATQIEQHGLHARGELGG